MCVLHPKSGGKKDVDVITLSVGFVEKGIYVHTALTIHDSRSGSSPVSTHLSAVVDRPAHVQTTRIKKISPRLRHPIELKSSLCAIVCRNLSSQSPHLAALHLHRLSCSTHQHTKPHAMGHHLISLTRNKGYLQAFLIIQSLHAPRPATALRVPPPLLLFFFFFSQPPCSFTRPARSPPLEAASPPPVSHH